MCEGVLIPPAPPAGSELSRPRPGRRRSPRTTSSALCAPNAQADRPGSSGSRRQRTAQRDAGRFRRAALAEGYLNPWAGRPGPSPPVTPRTSAARRLCRRRRRNAPVRTRRERRDGPSGGFLGRARAGSRCPGRGRDAPPSGSARTSPSACARTSKVRRGMAARRFRRLRR